MAERILPGPSLTPTASPVDRFVAPAYRQDEDGLGQLAESLSRVNPKLQDIITTQYTRNAEGEEAAGKVAEQSIDSEIALEGNRQGWQKLIKEVRKRDQQNGTDHAEALVGASPHFRRGLAKARVNRVGLGLQSHLQMQWQNDVGGIRSQDDPGAVREWLEEQTKAYTEKSGVTSLDPVLVAQTFTPRVAQSQEVIFGQHMSYRSKARVAEFTNNFESNIGLIAGGATGGASPVDDFIARMTISESSGDSSVINSEGYGGWLQFGQARLDDWSRATGSPRVTVKEFAANEGLQRRINRWHIEDIDKVIQSKGYLQQGYSLDGLRAVAHLGGIGGMMEFAESGGANGNTADSNGTSLKDYYNKFAGPSVALQEQADQAIANGVAPSKVNESIVKAITDQAVAMQDPTILAALDSISTGNGKLGNISWVKAARRAAEEKIEDEFWEEEQRQITRETQAREEAERTIMTDGFETILKDPDANIDEYIDMAIGSGNPQLAEKLRDFRKKLIGERDDVVTDHSTVIRLRNEIFSGAVPPGEIGAMIVDAVDAKMVTSSQAASLFDDLRGMDEIGDRMRDPGVLDTINDGAMIVRDRTEMKDWQGNILVSGRDKAAQWKAEMQDEMIAFIEENPEATKVQIRRHARKIQRQLLDMSEYQGVTQGAENVSMTDLDSDDPETQREATATQGVENPLDGMTEQQIEDMAAKMGVSVVQFMRDVTRGWEQQQARNQ